MSGGELERDALEGRLRRLEHALLRAIPRRALKAIRALQQIEPGPHGQVSTRHTAVYLVNLLSREEGGSAHHPQHCLLCHDRIDSRGGLRAHLGLQDAPGPRCAVFPAIVDIMRDCTGKRLEDMVERERWRETSRR